VEGRRTLTGRTVRRRLPAPAGPRAQSTTGNRFTIMKTYARIFLLALLASAVPAMAGNWNFIKDTPYGNFTPEDHKMFDEVLNTMLDKGSDGDSRAWSNPATKAGGEIKVVNSFKRGETPCRTLSIANRAKVYSATGEYKFCKKTDKWALAD
jgi:hypothetical protein